MATVQLLTFSVFDQHAGKAARVQKEFLHRFAGGPVRLKLASELFRNPAVKSAEVKQPG